MDYKKLTKIVDGAKGGTYTLVYIDGCDMWEFQGNKQIDTDVQINDAWFEEHGFGQEEDVDVENAVMNLEVGQSFTYVVEHPLNDGSATITFIKQA